MKYLNTNSLFQTIDNVSDALMFGFAIDRDEKFKIADFVISRQGEPYAYADTFAPTEYDLRQDLILYTGEKIKSRVGKCHMIGEEACRLLRKLDLQTDKIKRALERTDFGLRKQIDKVYENSRYEYGMYCCKSCSCGLWLNLSSGGLNNDTELLISGLNYLKRHRDNSGRWTGFPYYYILYVLNEIENDIAIDEMRFCAKSIERRLKKKRIEENKYEMRRNYICEQLLEKVNRI